jgi:hypothetical protein
MSNDAPAVPVSAPASPADLKVVQNHRKEAIVLLVLICILAVFTFWMLVENNGLQSRIRLLAREVDDLSVQNSDLQSEITRLQRVAEENKFQFYYADLAKQRYGVDDLQEYLDRWEWVEGSYVQGSFDCSEMSAYIEWRLENEGYHTIIVCGDSPFGGGYHAWLLVETSSGGYMPVEATTYEMVVWSDLYFDNYFEYDHSFETIQGALDYSQSEFDWWNS